SEAAVLAVPRHAHDLHGRGGLAPHADVAAQGLLAVPVAADEALVDDRDQRGTRPVGLREPTAADERRLQGLEVARTGAREGHLHVLARARRVALDQEAP